MKVVINNCFGGFSLSPLGLQEWAKRKGRECYFFLHEYERDARGRLVGEPRMVPCTLEEAAGRAVWFAYSVPNPEDYRLSERGPDGTFKDANERSREISLYCCNIERTDADLIAVVEELGERANGACASLKVVEVPDGVNWEIAEYDGNEHIAEKHNTWY